MKLSSVFLFAILFVTQLAVTSAQQVKFNRVIKNNLQVGSYNGFAQDREGFLWTIAYQNGTVPAVLSKYDGVGFKSFRPDQADSNSITNTFSICLYIDKNDIIWIGHAGGGLDRFDPSGGIFSHYRHKKNDANSLSDDTVTALVQDSEGKLWVGTNHGLNVMDAGTGKFKHYFKESNPKSISGNKISVLYKDHEGNLWIGCGGFKIPPVAEKSGDGGLNFFNEKSGTFTRYLYDPLNPKSITNNKISCIYEDSKGTFWVGTQQNGLHTLDRNTGAFTYYPYDQNNPDRLSSPPLGKVFINDQITFIQEDINKNLWIGTSVAGLYLYNRITKKMTHFGDFFRDGKEIYKDTAGGIKQFGFPKSIVTRDGLLWLSAYRPSTIYNINFNKLTVPFVALNANGNAFYQEPDGNVLWVGTNKGLIRKDIVHKTQKIWSSASPNNSGWAHDTIGNMVKDKNGIIWIATLGGGLCKFNPATNRTFYYMHDNKNPNSISSNMARNLLIDHNNNIWVGTWGQGLDMLDSKSQKFIHYVHTKDGTSLSNNTADYIFEDENKTIWVGGFGGLDRLNKDEKTFHHYLNNIPTVHIYKDKEGVMWIGTGNGLYYYDKLHNRFLPFIDPISQEQVPAVIGILEDDYGNLWVRSSSQIVRINKKRNQIKMYGEARGIISNSLWICRCLKGKNGELFFGTLGGYNEFFPDEVKDIAPPIINITKFELNNAGLNDRKSEPINTINFYTKKIELAHDQNTFSADFIALHYISPGEEKYRIKLENYDHVWRDLGTEHQTSFFDVPPGTYKLQIRAFNADGVMGEKELVIVINPPWWETWWAYTLFTLFIIGVLWGFIEYRGRKLIAENKILEEKVTQRTEELQHSLQELRATQTQLIQSEKMASLGELTAGIAHEIQNPLNFVNNFCEVNTELIDEMKEEIDSGNLDGAKSIADDIKENQQKINHHGKRADAIVKGMLLHSRKSTGQKEPTDINTLADEYLRLSYHGLRAKDKSFNATMETDFDPNLDKINVVAQDIGRVLLNLFNNAFYAVSEKKRQKGRGYEPTICVSTKKLNDNKVEIKIRDNGNGIAQKAIDKMFQPFFTTKPTGEGTGLGLSISYDIISKVHNGNIKAETKEGEFAEFIVVLPG